MENTGRKEVVFKIVVVSASFGTMYVGLFYPGIWPVPAPGLPGLRWILFVLATLLASFLVWTLSRDMRDDIRTVRKKKEKVRKDEEELYAFTQIFGVYPIPPSTISCHLGREVVQEKIGDVMEDLAVTFVRRAKEQSALQVDKKLAAELLSTDSSIRQAAERRLEIAASMVGSAKRRFWKAHELAKRFRYQTLDSSGDYTRQNEERLAHRHKERIRQQANA